MERTLKFKNNLYGKPTRFLEKTFKSLYWNTPLNEVAREVMLHADFDTGGLDFLQPKIHTIRRISEKPFLQEAPFRVGESLKLGFFDCAGNQITPCLSCTVKSVQTFSVKYKRDGTKTTAQVFIDGRFIGEAIWDNCQLKDSSFTLDILIQNDGFDDVNQFFEWFDKDYEGVIVHWIEGFKY